MNSKLIASMAGLATVSMAGTDQDYVTYCSQNNKAYKTVHDMNYHKSSYERNV